jgi:hypothetical protein
VQLILDAILLSLHHLHQKVNAMSVTVSDLTAAIAQSQTDLGTLLGDLSAQVAALQAQITALQGTTAPDLSGALTAIQALDASIKAATPAPASPAAGA